MKLSYRGIAYESTSLELPTIATGTTMQYRGASYALRHVPTDVPLHHPSGMIYRGISGDRCFKGSFLGRVYYKRVVEFIPMPAEA